MEKVFLTWNHIENFIDVLAIWIKTNPQIKIIYGLPRGGTIPGVLLSHKTGIKYSNDWPLLKHLYKQEEVLIVDDICDTGKTLEYYVNYGYPTVTLHYKEDAICKPSFFTSTIDKDTWILYPWERSDSAPIQDYLINKK